MRRDLGTLLRDDRIVLGTWNQIPSPEIVDIIGWAGFEFAVIDCEHGSFGIETAENLGRACDAVSIAPAIRIPSCDTVWIGKALDAGIGHVVVPDVSSADELQRAVDATRFAPHGSRGACPCVRAGRHFTEDWKGYSRQQDEETGLIALVETVAGVDAFDDIIDVDGLASIMLGPFDLAVSMGLDGDWRASEVREATRSMARRAIERDIPVIVPIFSPDLDECGTMLEEWRSIGVRTFLIGTDKIIAAHALGHIHATLSDR